MFFRTKCKNKFRSSETISRVSLFQKESTGFGHTCRWTTKLLPISLTGNGPRQLQLQWRQCPRPQGISSPPPPPLPLRWQPFLAVVVHAQDNDDNNRSLSTITVVSIIVVHCKDHQKCIQRAFCPPLLSHFAFAKLLLTPSSWLLPPCFHCCHIYCHAAVVVLPLPTN